MVQQIVHNKVNIRFKIMHNTILSSIYCQRLVHNNIIIRNKPFFENAVLSLVYVIQYKNTSSHLSEIAKTIFVKTK